MLGRKTPKPTAPAKSTYFATTTSTKNVTKVSLKRSTTSVVTKVGRSLQLTVPTVGTKSVLVKLTMKDPSGKSYTIASATVAKNKAYTSAIVKFAKAGSYVVTLLVGTSKKVVSVKVGK